MQDCYIHYVEGVVRNMQLKLSRLNQHAFYLVRKKRLLWERRKKKRKPVRRTQNPEKGMNY